MGKKINLEWFKRIILTDFQYDINIDANANYISEKNVKIAYAKDNSILRLNRLLGESYSPLEEVNLHIILNNDKKYKIVPSKFIVIGSDWPD
jgi:hypothetical protein